MGLILPSRENSADQVRALMARKDVVEAEIDAQHSILKANSVTLRTPLVDREGFPRADIDVYAVRHARVRIIELRNDHAAIMDSIAKALQEVYRPDPEGASASTSQPVAEPVSEVLVPFAKVDGVAPESPAATAGLLREDLVLSFGPLVKSSFSTPSLRPLAEYVATQENHGITIKILRAPERSMTLTLTPRAWGGRGLLGCHLTPFSST